MEVVGVTDLFSIGLLLAIRLELLHEFLMLLFLLHIESMLTLKFPPVNPCMLLFEVFEIDELLSFLLPVHDLLVDELRGRSFATLSDFLQTVELDHILAAESFLLGFSIIAELLALVNLFLEFTKMWHLDQKFMELVSRKTIEDSGSVAFIKLLALNTCFG